MAHDLPREIFVITQTGKWPLKVYNTETAAIFGYEAAVKEEGGQKHRVKLRRCRLEEREELVVQRTDPVLVPAHDEVEAPDGLRD